MNMDFGFGQAAHKVIISLMLKKGGRGLTFQIGHLTKEVQKEWTRKWNLDKFFQLDVTAFLFFNADAEEYLISFMIVDLQDQIKYDYDSTGIFHWTHHRFLQRNLV